MGERTIKKGPGPLALGLAFFFGAASFLLGLHFLSKSNGGSSWSFKKGFLAHLGAVFLLGSLGASFFWVFPRAFSWCAQASGYNLVLAALGFPAVFLVLQVLFPKFLRKLVPYRKTFLCPQCYQTQDFRFQPVSRLFGSWVTYLCPYCSCLADSWGEQIFFPVNLPLKEFLVGSWRTVLPALLALASGGVMGVVLFGIHCVK